MTTAWLANQKCSGALGSLEFDHELMVSMSANFYTASVVPGAWVLHDDAWIWGSPDSPSRDAVQSLFGSQLTVA